MPQSSAHANATARILPGGRGPFPQLKPNQGTIMTDAPATPEQPQAPQGPALRILTQYIKDLSFENPGAPESLRAGGAAPNIDMGIDVQARTVSQGIYEVTLNFSAKAERGEGGDVVFIAQMYFVKKFSS